MTDAHTASDVHSVAKNSGAPRVCALPQRADHRLDITADARDDRLNSGHREPSLIRSLPLQSLPQLNDVVMRGVMR